jgi:hypothetical protein
MMIMMIRIISIVTESISIEFYSVFIYVFIEQAKGPIIKKARGKERKKNK